MAGESFNRPRDGYRFHFGGWKTNASPDSLPPDKFPAAVNIRAVSDNSVQTRPGQVLNFSTGGNPVTDLRSYVALETDGLPRFLARDNTDAIWLDDGTQVGTLTPGSLGAVFIPFRPNQSPDPYMYIANGADYQKFSAPNPTVNASKVGIAEPQTSCESAQVAQQFTEILSPGGNWNTGGTASAWTFGSRSTDIVVTAINDPVSPFKEGQIHPSVPPRWSVQVSNVVQYQRGEIVYFNGAVPLITIIEEVIAPLSISMTVQAIYFPPGPSEPAVVTLRGITAASKATPKQEESGIILNNTDIIAQLVRGALVQVGGQTTFVQSVTSGPDNQICIECFLASTHVAGETVIGLPTIIVNGVQNSSSLASGTPIIGDMDNVENFTVGAGIGTLTTGPPGGGPTGTIIATPTSTLNGWGPNAHVGAYEMGTAQNFGWGLDPSTTSGYNNPNNVSDGNTSTFADATGQHTHTYYGSIWTFTTGTAQNNMVLNILSRVLANGDDGLIVNTRSAGIWYSLDGGTNWQQVYNMGPDLPTPTPLSRPKQWDSIPLPANQDITQVQVMAFTDSHDDMVHRVYIVNISAGAASIGVNTGAYQEQDYLHFSILTDNPADLIEARVQFDVADGTFLTNYYYYAVRPSDLVPATTNTAPLTQLGAIQSIVAQTETEKNAGAIDLAISSPTVAGQGQWTEIWIPISELTRIGGDQTKTLANINAVQIWVNALNTIRISTSSIAFVGGGQPDVGDIGEPYRYRVVPFSSVTGVMGNPSPDMRYGVPARRQPNQVNLPSDSYDTQIDTWRVYRFGGTISEWRFIGSCDSGRASFEDNYSDDAASAGTLLDFDNFEPWPSIDYPLNATASTICGFIAVVTIPSPTLVERYLPGNQVNLGGQNVYTLRIRPVLLSGNSYQFEFNECTVGFNQGTISDNGEVTIYEPALARQFLPYMWGPDVNGTIFAVGDPLRPGNFYFSKGNAPDNAPDAYNIELCPPSEPLIGGVIVDGRSFVASTERWWALYPNPSNPAQRYVPQQQPISRGLVAPYGCCTDGVSVFFWAKDGIWSTSDGSLTDDDLYNLFPHDGVEGIAQGYGPPGLVHTVLPPDYARAGTFRLEYENYYLYATYQDANGIFNTLVYDTRRKAWSVDVYGVQVTRFYHVEQQVGTLLSISTEYPSLMMANTSGQILEQTALSNDNGVPIESSIATFEDPGGDTRAPKQWGDIFLDANLPAPTGMAVSMMSLGVQVATPLALVQSAPRTRQPLGVGGLVTSDFMGLFFTWTDDYTLQAVPTVLHIWHASFVVQPATTISWQTLGSSFGMQGYGHIRQIAVSYISSADITLSITSYDGQSPVDILIPASGGQYRKTLFPVSANKGQLFSFRAVSTETFQFFLDDWELALGPWSRETPYLQLKTLSGPFVDSAPI
jgi:hypothetical protein